MPYVVYEYAANGSSILRATYTDYRTDQVYLDQRIIGLVHARHVYDATANPWALVTKIDYNYDATGEYLVNQGAATQHDPNVGQWRGNVIQERRWDTGAPSDVSRSVSTYASYNTTGSVIFTRDGLGHQANISYNDVFSDGNNSRGTFAYPTHVTDPDNHTSVTHYDYSTGDVRLRQDPKGASEELIYDSVGRLERVLNRVNGAYTRWEYPATINAKKSFTTIVAGAGELYSIEYYDGAGRGRATASQHPGSVGGFRGVHLWRDSIGRVVQQSNPTEITDEWVTVGDDQQAGMRVTYQTYDWQGRPTVTTNTDGSTRGSEYGGCG
ncbi:MAG: hypothetical protein M3430_04720, partial [Acidobacteriota bacterium]|nr:hypothetical protein [Acidobacteriota bacterium]